MAIGAYNVAAKACDMTGGIATATRNFQVVPNPFDVPFRVTLDNFKVALASGNKAAAMNLLSVAAQQNYSEIFDALFPDMAGIVASWSPPRRLSNGDDFVEYLVSRDWDGETKFYVIGFIRDEDGVWVIDSL